jgi:pimeloyl-ACP methyl ester carboxylesterase
MVVDATVSIAAGPVTLAADLVVPDLAQAVVLFAHGSGSSRRSPRNRLVAERLHEQRFATLLADLLTEPEARSDAKTAALRFDIGLLADRLTAVIDWAADAEPVRRHQIGLFGASTGAAAALVAAAQRPALVRAVVSRGGRPDLAGDALGRVRAPTLLIVGEWDGSVVDLNRQAAGLLAAPHRIHIVPGATHLFEEPGALPEVAAQAAGWFETHLGAGVPGQA